MLELAAAFPRGQLRAPDGGIALGAQHVAKTYINLLVYAPWRKRHRNTADASCEMTPDRGRFLERSEPWAKGPWQQNHAPSHRILLCVRLLEGVRSMLFMAGAGADADGAAGADRAGVGELVLSIVLPPH